MTPAEIITQVRNIISDTAAPLRYSDTVLLGFVNQTIKRIASFRPDVFAYIGDLATTPGSVLQSLPSDAVRLVEVFQVKGGSAVTEVNRETLDQMYPGWTTEPAGTPVNFMRHSRNPAKYFLYPRPAAGVELVVEYVRVIPAYALADTIESLPESYFPILVDGTVFMAESIDNEHASNDRAKMFYDLFLQAMNASLGTRVISDAENAAVNAP